MKMIIVIKNYDIIILLFQQIIYISINYTLEMYNNKSSTNSKAVKQKAMNENIQNLDSSLAIFDHSNIIYDIRNKLFDTNLITQGSEKQNQKHGSIQKTNIGYSPLKIKKQYCNSNANTNIKQLIKVRHGQNRSQYIKCHEDQVIILQRQNTFLKNEINKLKVSYNQLLQKQIQKKQAEMTKQHIEQIQHIKAQYHLQIQQKSSHITELTKQLQNLKIFSINHQKYIHNLETINQTMEVQIKNYSNQIQRIAQLQKLLEQTNLKNSHLQEAIKEKQQELNLTINQLNYENQSRNISVYIHQLQKTNMLLQKQNRRLTQIIMERARSGFR